MKIGIIELCSDTHYTPVIARARVFLYGNNEIKVFVNQDMVENLKSISKEKNIEIIPRGKKENMYHFLKKIEKEKFDILFITTLQKHYLTFLTFNPKKTGATVNFALHNVNEWIGGLKIYGIKKFIIKILRKIMLNKCDNISVGSQSLKDYVLEKFDFKKPIMVIPFIMYEPKKDLSGDKEKLKVIVPGTLSEGRREYLKMFDAYDNLSDDNKKKFSLELLGAPSRNRNSRTDEIIDKCKKMGDGVIFYERFLTAKEYNERLMKSDLVFGPFKIEFGGSKGEIYGLSKDTGVNFNMIAGAKPGLLPEKFVNFKELGSSTLTFNDYKDAFDKIIGLSMDKKKVSELKKKALKNSKCFSAESVRKRLMDEGLI